MLDLADRDGWLAEAGEVNLGIGIAYQLGDANLDAVVDGLDFIVWNQHKFTSGNLWSGGDFNADGVTDGFDFIVWNENKFTSATIPGNDKNEKELQSAAREEIAVEPLRTSTHAPSQPPSVWAISGDGPRRRMASRARASENHVPWLSPFDADETD